MKAITHQLSFKLQEYGRTSPGDTVLGAWSREGSGRVSNHSSGTHQHGYTASSLCRQLLAEGRHPSASPLTIHSGGEILVGLKEQCKI